MNAGWIPVEERLPGSAQAYVLRRLANLGDWERPDSRTGRVLESMALRGWVYSNFGRWQIKDAGRVALARHDLARAELLRDIRAPNQGA